MLNCLSVYPSVCFMLVIASLHLTLLSKLFRVKFINFVGIFWDNIISQLVLRTVQVGVGRI